MNRLENIDFCIRCLASQTEVEAIPSGSLQDRQRLLRSLMNIWRPQPLSAQYLAAQDRELQAQLADKGIVEIDLLTGSQPCLWQGDITRLKVDAIVNAANSQMMGCWQPMHPCIDNCIHSAAGLQLRAECAKAMSGAECPPLHPEYTMDGVTYREAFTSETLITRGYNLPARHVIHTVGPIAGGGVPSSRQRKQLADCYTNCLNLAKQAGCHSIAFCCISTGVFGYPNREAAEVAIHTVRGWLAANNFIKVVFNVFKDIDYDIYRQLLSQA